MEFGSQVVGFLLWVAQLLVSEGAPGWVALGMGVALVILISAYLIQSSARSRAALDLRRRVTAYAGITEFSSGFEEFRAELLDFRKKSAVHEVLWQNWDEYAETIVRDDVDGTVKLRNSVRPGNFLNLEDLGFTAGFFRIVPSTFVSFGLLCTFLGLVAALSSLGDDLSKSAAPDVVVISLMKIASAKFTMSLVGLACSIAFGLVLRWRQGRLDGILHGLCLALERRLVFVSLEDIGFRQLRAAEEQREYLRKIGMEMVAELSRPLNELPREITSSITQAMEPMFAKVSQMGTSSMEGIVGDLSGQISQSVGNALTRASDSLGEASDRIGQMVDRMNSSNAQMGEGMQTALGQMATAIGNLKAQVEATGQTASSTMNEGAERLLAVMNDTLEGIRQNTGDGARAISAAAEEMRKAAETFRDELSQATEDGAATARARMGDATSEAQAAISGAGQALMDAFGKTGQDIARLGDEMGSRIGGDITSRLDTLAAQLSNASEAVAENATGLRTAATAIKSGGDSIAAASTAFGGASRDLLSAIDPVRASHLRIEGSVQALSEQSRAAVDTVTRASETVARESALILETARVALGNEREGMVQALQAIRVTLNGLKDQAKNLDDIDEMLGKALSDYSNQLEGALGLAQSHVEKMRDTLGPGIDTLRSFVERAETFIPSTRRA